MRPPYVTALILVLATTASQSVTAQEMRPAPAHCVGATPALPAALAGWVHKNPVTAATAAGGLKPAMLALDRGATVRLHPTRSVSYVVQPDKPGGSVAHGGLVGVMITEPGTYQINLGSGAWIDLVRDGAKVVSTAHAPGPACSGIRKTVQFPLHPGRYVIQISANADPTLAVMVSRAP
jgi:hypothetical protein